MSNIQYQSGGYVISGSDSPGLLSYVFDNNGGLGNYTIAVGYYPSPESLTAVLVKVVNTTESGTIHFPGNKGIIVTGSPGSDNFPHLYFRLRNVTDDTISYTTEVFTLNSAGFSLNSSFLGLIKAGKQYELLVTLDNESEDPPQNLILYSETLEDTAYWFPNDAVLTANQSNDGLGSPTLELVSFNAEYANFQAFVTVTASTQYTMSFEMTRGTVNDIYFRTNDASNGFVLIAATTNLYSSINSSTPTRVSLTFTTPVGCTSLLVTVGTNATTGTAYVGRAQLNTGATVKPYATTTTTTVP